MFLFHCVVCMKFLNLRIIWLSEKWFLHDIIMCYVQDLTILSFEQVIRCVSHSWLPYKHSVFEMMENHHHAYVLCMQTETVFSIFRYTLAFSSFMCIKITLYCWHDSNRTFTLQDSWSCLLHQGKIHNLQHISIIF